MVCLSTMSVLCGMDNTDDPIERLTAQFGDMSTSAPIPENYGMTLNIYARVCKTDAHYNELFALCQDDASRNEVELMRNSALASIALLAGDEMSPLKKLEYFAADNKWYDRRKRIVLSMIAAGKKQELFACKAYDPVYDALQAYDGDSARQLILLGAPVSPASASVLDHADRQHNLNPSGNNNDC